MSMQKDGMLLKVACAFGALACASTQTQAQPNIVFILADDLGYCDLACYGNKYIKTPNIDRLAETGTTFTQCYAGSGVSSPSRCALMTGRHTGNTTIRDNFCVQGGIEGKKGDKTIRRMHILPNDTTLAHVLGAAGGESGLIYLCPGYRQFFSHVAPYMDFMAAELRANRAPANVMKALASFR